MPADCPSRTETIPSEKPGRLEAAARRSQSLRSFNVAGARLRALLGVYEHCLRNRRASMPRNIQLRLLLLLLIGFGAARRTFAQSDGSASQPASGPQSADANATPSVTDAPDDSAVTLFPHSQTSRFWISGQANIVLQWHPYFSGGLQRAQQHAQSCRKCDVKGLHTLPGLRADPRRPRLFWISKARAGTA
jgi:hypothetical protein